MACSSINMFNPADPQQQGLYPPPMSPRISFSNDFVLQDPPPPAPRRDRISDPDFEFSVGTRPMIAADELFFKGRMLPLGGGAGAQPPPQRVTLRDELRAQDEARWDAARPPKGSGSIRWKELLGLKKAATCAAAGKRSELPEAAEAAGKAQQDQCKDAEMRYRL